LCNQLLGTKVPPNHRLVVPNINMNHLQGVARNTQKRVVSHYPLTTQKIHNPLVFSYNYPYFPPYLFLSTCPTQGMYPFIDISPSESHSFIRVSLAQVTKNLSIGNSIELTARKHYQQQQQTLIVIVKLTQEFTLHSQQYGSSILFSKYTP
jgi:hypothetical protein